MSTTIQISTEVRKELEKLKIHRREALNEVIKRLIDIDESVGGFDVNEIEEIKNSLIDLKKGDFSEVF
jgi:predicted CopG family antitoxin